MSMDTTKLKCVVCKKVPTEVGHRVEGKLKKRWCADGVYHTKDTVWCVPCWDKQVAEIDEYRKRQDKENQDLLERAMKGVK